MYNKNIVVESHLLPGLGNGARVCICPLHCSVRPDGSCTLVQAWGRQCPSPLIQSGKFSSIYSVVLTWVIILSLITVL